MKNKAFLAVLAVLFCGIQVSRAQTNLQVFYDFGKDRNQVTTTLEGFYNDKWGNTFFFVDYDYRLRAADGNKAPDGTYFELARCLNFWQDSALAPLSLQLEYNGGVYSHYGINHAFLVGADWFLHSADFRNTFNFKLLYKGIVYDDASMRTKLPLQFTFVWGMNDLFGVEGLRFSGFADFWGQQHYLFENQAGEAMLAERSDFVFISEPQLWYSLGEHLNIGGELELSYDFGTCQGFRARPCLGVKWGF